MTQSDIIQTLLKDTNYYLDLFNTSEIQDLHQQIEGTEKPSSTARSVEKQSNSNQKNSSDSFM